MRITGFLKCFSTRYLSCSDCKSIPQPIGYSNFTPLPTASSKISTPSVGQALKSFSTTNFKRSINSLSNISLRIVYHPYTFPVPSVYSIAQSLVPIAYYLLFIKCHFSSIIQNSAKWRGVLEFSHGKWGQKYKFHPMPKPILLPTDQKQSN